MNPASIAACHDNLRRAVKNGVWTSPVREAIVAAVNKSVDFLGSVERVPEESHVANKSYAAFRSGTGTASRVFNTALYDADVCQNQLEAILTEGLGGRSRDDITKTLYTAAMSFFCANDIESNNQARGRSGKYFEYLVGNIMATALGVKGTARIEALNPELARGLNPDHLFELGDGGALIHLAVKISTRERIVQPWAHQRILDGAYGTDRIKGVMVFLHETNRLKTGIQETCTPARLRQYQMFVARIHALYYFDPPRPYLELADAYPFVPVRPIAMLKDDATVLKDPSPWRQARRNPESV